MQAGSIESGLIVASKKNFSLQGLTMAQETILIIDDEAFIRENVQRILAEDGYNVLSASNGAEAQQLLTGEMVDLALLDLNLGIENGLQVLENLKEIQPDLLVIIITGYGSVESAVDSLKLGAFDYMKKPFKADALRVIVKLALQTQELKREVRTLRLSGSLGHTEPLIGESAPMRIVHSQIQDVAKIPTSTVLITGESGTGKELVARAIHALSDRRDKPFVAVNCASIPAELIESELFGHEKGAFTGAGSRKIGLFEQADYGTIFLDEIGDMYASLQAKLLRVLQERSVRRVGGNKDIPINIRVIAATNRDLRQRIELGTFREDLFYRLHVVPIHLPSLRERGDDISLLTKHFLLQFSQLHGKAPLQLTPEAEKHLLAYHWPGNVRELRNVIERVCIMVHGAVLDANDLPFELHPTNAFAYPEPCQHINCALGLEVAVAEFEKQIILAALEKTQYNVVKAALNLKIPRGTLRYKMDKYGFNA